MTSPEPNPNVLLIATDDPAAVEREYAAAGWHCSDLYTKPGFPELCGECQWAVRMWRTPQPEQRDLF
jgi:hypothetical protein